MPERLCDLDKTTRFQGRLLRVPRLLVSVLCFSKDRPLQLEAYLSSLFRLSATPMAVSVLYRCSPLFERAYVKLRSQFPQVDFIRETDFRDQVLSCVQGAETPLFMFGCDDVVFKRPWEPIEVWKAFELLPELLGFSLRLGREIVYCYPANRAMSTPRFLGTNPFLVWRWLLGEADWGYPWELDCTVYCTEFVRTMLTALEKLDWAHPNRLEGLGADLMHSVKGLDLIGFHFLTKTMVVARFVRGMLMMMDRVVPSGLENFSVGLVLETIVRQARGLGLMASYPSARASVITINRVQDVTLNRVYEGNLTVNVLLEKWNAGAILDIDAYVDRSYPSIHIGEAYFSRRSEWQDLTLQRSMA